ncbi:MAG: nucleotidyl transferase AbiEii/AbiGii toxin family protein [Phycisphaerales bacterium JB065]
MATKRKYDADFLLAEKIKRLTIVALVSDDDFFDRLVLKGGNAIEHTGIRPVRKSIDIDFSLDGSLDLLGSLSELQSRIAIMLNSTFSSEGLHVFDVRLKERPENLKEDVLGEFWGGYEIRFKVIEAEAAKQCGLEQQRRRAIPLGRSERKEFSIDISKHEYCGEKRIKEIDGFNVYVYSERMIVCEKIRAICQQMPAYRETVQSTSGSPRARDFFDIYYISTTLALDFTTDEFWDTLRQVFAAKHVPEFLLGEINAHREFHRENFESVKDTVLREVDLKNFDFYVDYLVKKLAPLKPRWEVDLPAV